MRTSKSDFIRQLGFTTPDSTDGLYSGLMFQPRVVSAMLALGIVFQSPWIFIVLSAMLWWGALVPAHNPFDVFFNRVIAPWRRFVIVPPAPEPKRFAGGAAAAMGMAIALALLAGVPVVAWLLEGMFAGAATAVIAGRFCGPAVMYHRFSATR